MRKYNKLIRDKVPEIIEKAGKNYEVRQLENSEYIGKLVEKLREETNEFTDSKELEELADIVEVILAILDFKDESWDKLEKIRKEKANTKGQFDEKLLLVQVED